MKPANTVEKKKKTPKHLARAAKDAKETRSFDAGCGAYACQLCGAEPGDTDPFNPGREIKLLMELIFNELKGGRDKPESVRITCANCKEGLQNISLTRPNDTELMKLVGRAKIEDQRYLLDWLEKKFESTRPKRLKHPSIFDLDVRIEHKPKVR